MTLGLVLNTRPSFYQDKFHDAFGDLPWAIYDCPITRPEPVSTAISPAADFDAVVFTSQLAVAAFAPGPEWLQKQVYAVGPGTAEAAAAAGFKNVLQTGADVDDMRRFLSQAAFGAALYPSAEEVSADLAVAFPGRIRREVVYRMVPRADLPSQLLTPLLAGTPVVAPLFSRRGADILADLLTKAGVTRHNARIAAVGISGNVFADETGPWQHRLVAEQPTLPGVADKTGEAIRQFED